MNEVSIYCLDELFIQNWWARVGLNHRPLPCQDSALPLSYAPLIIMVATLP